MTLLSREQLVETGISLLSRGAGGSGGTLLSEGAGDALQSRGRLVEAGLSLLSRGAGGSKVVFAKLWHRPELFHNIL